MPDVIETAERTIPLKTLEKAPLILEPDPANRVYVVSFPKTGRTWTRVLMSRYKQMTLQVPEFHLYLHRIFAAGPPVSPQVLFSHAGANYPTNRVEGRWFKLLRLLRIDVNIPARMNLDACVGSRVVFLVRDPRDVITSYYHHRSKRIRRYNYSGPPSVFIRDRDLGLPNLLAFMNFLLEQSRRFEHLFVFYEDMRGEARGQLERILQFAGFDVDGAALEDAVAYGSFDNMKRLETQGSYGKELKQRISGDPNSMKVRKGRVGGYKDELDAADVAYLDEQIATRLDPFYHRYIRPA